jgi:hypothetical protein
MLQSQTNFNFNFSTMFCILELTFAQKQIVNGFQLLYLQEN